MLGCDLEWNAAAFAVSQLNLAATMAGSIGGNIGLQMRSELHVPEDWRDELEHAVDTLSKGGRLDPLSHGTYATSLNATLCTSSASCLRFVWSVARTQSMLSLSSCGMSGQPNQASDPAPNTEVHGRTHYV